MGEHIEKSYSAQNLAYADLALDWLCVSQIRAQYFIPKLRVLWEVLGAEKSSLIRKIRQCCLKEKSG